MNKLEKFDWGWTPTKAPKQEPVLMVCGYVGETCFEQLNLPDGVPYSSNNVWGLFRKESELVRGRKLVKIDQKFVRIITDGGYLVGSILKGAKSV